MAAFVAWVGEGREKRGPTDLYLTDGPRSGVGKAWAGQGLVILRRVLKQDR